MTNETIDTVIKRDTIEGGYTEFQLCNLQGLEEPLKTTVMERLIEKLIYVQRFHLIQTILLPSEVREQLVEFASTVIE